MERDGNNMDNRLTSLFLEHTRVKIYVDGWFINFLCLGLAFLPLVIFSLAILGVQII